MIPVRNLFVMLAYAWDALDLIERMPTGSEPWGDDVATLLGVVLASETKRVMRRGLHRDYLSEVESSVTPRGRIRLQDTLRNVARRQLRLTTEVDELSVDSNANRVLKSTARALNGARCLDKGVRRELQSTLGQLKSISDVPLSSAALSRHRLNRSNRYYRLVFEIARFVLESSLPDESGTGSEFTDIRRDPVRMRILFQRFVRSFLSREQSQFSVSAPHLSWGLMPATPISGVSLPRMQTDIVLTSASRIVVIDTKFTANVFDSYRGSVTARSPHLYQLWAYISHIRTEGRAVDGVLLYPAPAEKPFNHSWEGPGARIRLVGVDLAAPWRSVKSALLSIVTT